MNPKVYNPFFCVLVVLDKDFEILAKAGAGILGKLNDIIQRKPK